MENIFKGIGVALVTPFNNDGEINYKQLVDLVEYQLAGGIDFFCVLGSTAETPCLSNNEKLEIKKTVVQQVNGRVPILLGMGSNCTQHLVSEIKDFDFQGIDGILSVCPYYNKPSQEGIYQHYKNVTTATSLPVVVYNVPGRSAVNIEATTMLRMANDFSNVIAVKEASGNIQQVDAILEDKPKNFDVISGDDPITFELISMGASGVISVIGNAFPELFGKMVHYLQENNKVEALKIHRQLFDFYKLLFVDGNPSGVKALLNIMGKIDNNLRLPLVSVKNETKEKIKDALYQLK